MSTLDNLVTTDLAALANDNRRQLPTLDKTSRSIGLNRDDHATRPGESREHVPGELVLVSMSRVFAHRIARAASGATAMVCAAVLLIVFKFGGLDDSERDRWWHWLTEPSIVFLGTLVGVLVLGAHVVASGIAERVFERSLHQTIDRDRVAGPLDLGKRLIRRADGWAVVLGITGVMSFMIMFGVLVFVLGGERWSLFLDRDYRFGMISPKSVFTDRSRDIAIAIALCLAAAIAIGRACVAEHRSHRRSWWIRLLEHGTTVPTGVLLALVTLTIGFSLDVGTIAQGSRGNVWPSSELRSALTVSGGAAVLLVVTGFTLIRRRREHERMGL